MEKEQEFAKSVTFLIVIAAIVIGMLAGTLVATIAGGIRIEHKMLKYGIARYSPSNGHFQLFDRSTKTYKDE